MMPEMDGWQACRRLREMSDVPILLLTALDSGDDVVRGLNLGADDYVTKPVAFEILVARTRALLRRRAGARLPGSHSRAPMLTHENLVIDFRQHKVSLDGERVELSPTEFRLLAVLARHQGRVLPHEFLLSEVWGSEYVGELDYLRLYVSYLRRKLEKDPRNPDLIHNEWGIGYRFG
jgi:two-component system KDP operon response regulator KdpE